MSVAIIPNYHKRRTEVSIVRGQGTSRMKDWKCALAISLLFCLLSGCVTRIEKRPYRPYAVPEEKSLSQELRQVFGRDSKPDLRTSQDPFYQRFAKRLRRTVGGLFGQEASARTPGEELRRQVEKEQTEAIRRLREQTVQE